jgi:hypothetical protein
MKSASGLLALAVMLTTAHAARSQTVYPVKDGTLADGSVYGPFDGEADDADWIFNQSSYEGSISRSVTAPSSEHRVVWEYDLSSVTQAPPAAAMLRFTLRGAPIFPFPDSDVHVYAYPADLQESMSDFHVGPARLQGVATVASYQPPTEFTVNVSAEVNAALISGSRKVAFRFQIDPATPHAASQAFIDALDSNASTKPRLVIEAAPSPPGDVDGDGDVDLDDFAGFPPCMSGPNRSPESGCQPYDFDQDGDVDLADLQAFQRYVADPN